MNIAFANVNWSADDAGLKGIYSGFYIKTLRLKILFYPIKIGVPIQIGEDYTSNPCSNS
jgi:hypothetical protein